MAQTQHWCDRCFQYIEPGQHYEGFVHLYEGQRYRLMVLKFHVDPGCEYPPDPDEEMEEIIPYETEIPLKLAA